MSRLRKGPAAVIRTSLQTERRPLNQSGADAFLRSLYARHSSSLRGLVFRMVGDLQHAEDVVQETMLRAWRNFDTLGADQSAIGGWLATVARNIVIDRIRAKRSRPRTVDDETIFGELPWSIGDHSDQAVTSVLVARALASLGPAHRAVIQQVYFADRTCAEAAVVLGIPVGTVKSRLYYALRNLRAVLDEQPS
jgi:RNA polymerase sigma-70 factor (ECF subfamily)